MSFLVSGIGSCVDGGKNMATGMYLSHTTAVMVTSWSIMATAIRKYRDVLSGVFILCIDYLTYFSVSNFVTSTCLRFVIDDIFH